MTPLVIQNHNRNFIYLSSYCKYIARDTQINSDQDRYQENNGNMKRLR